VVGAKHGQALETTRVVLNIGPLKEPLWCVIPFAGGAASGSQNCPFNEAGELDANSFLVVQAKQIFGSAFGIPANPQAFVGICGLTTLDSRAVFAPVLVTLFELVVVPTFVGV
jgi:hypothetical protein